MGGKFLRVQGNDKKWSAIYSVSVFNIRARVHPSLIYRECLLPTFLATDTSATEVHAV